LSAAEQSITSVPHYFHNQFAIFHPGRRSEMRVVHELSRTLGRDVLLGSTSLETPESFVDTLYKLTV